MEILDQDEQTINVKNKNLALISLLGYMIAGITALIGLYGSLLSLSALNTPKAPDAVLLSRGIGISDYAQLVMIVVLLIGVICQNVPASENSFHKPWVWRLILVISILTLLASFIPLSPILLIITSISLIQAFRKQNLYFKDEKT